MYKLSAARDFIISFYEIIKRYKYFFTYIFFISYFASNIVYYVQYVIPSEYEEVEASNDALLLKMDDCEAQYDYIDNWGYRDFKTEYAILLQFFYLQRLYNNTDCITPKRYEAYLGHLALTLKFQDDPLPFKILSSLGLYHNKRDWVYGEIHKESVLAAVATTYGLTPIKRPSNKE